MKLITNPIGLHNGCFWMAPISNASCNPGIKTLICEHPRAVNWTIEFDTVNNVTEKVNGDNL